MTSGSEPDKRPRRGRGAGWAVALALALAALVLVLWLRGRGQDQAPGAEPGPPGPPATGDAPAPSPGPVPSRQPPGPLPVLVTSSAELHASLREEAEPVASDVVVEGIEADRTSLCAGEPAGVLNLAARVSGEAPGAVQRWIWRRADGEVELQPGAAMAWPAPSAPGWYRLHFQVLTDLGGRRVGVLAERAIDVEVHACAPGETEPSLRIAVSQRGHGVFAFTAVVAERVLGEAPGIDFAWDFGDGAQATTTGPAVEHTYDVTALGEREEARFVVRLIARREGAEPLSATTMVAVRGFPEPRTEGPVTLAIERWQLDPARERWQSAITVRPREQAITWDRLERITKYADDRADMATLDWRDVIAIDEDLPAGGFRGHVLVPVAQVPPDVKQIIDVLYGHTSGGEEVSVSWTPFKRPVAPIPGGISTVPGK